MADQEQLRRRMAMEEEEAAEGEPGHAGHDLYKDGPAAHQSQEPSLPSGNLWDTAKTAADTAALGAGPQISGLIAAELQAAKNFGAQPGDAMDAIRGKATEKRPSALDAYRDTRDATEEELGNSRNTLAGKAGVPLGMMLTPLPIKELGPGATIGQKVLRGAKVGGAVGAIHGATASSGDLTKLDPGDARKVIVDALLGGGAGVVGGGAVGAVGGAAEPKLSGFADTQALRAAGLRGGIKNSIQKDLGISNMDDARKLGRAFLDTKLIPPVGSAEAVGKRAQGLVDLSGRTIGRTLNEADSTGLQPFDFKAFGGAARKTLDDSTSVADKMSGQKARALADALEAQGERTPGSFVGANNAKSDAWKSARFDEDAPMSAVLYRKANGAARNDIERQVGDVLGPDDAQLLNDANSLYGVGSDALKLSENASTRDAAKKGIGMHEIMGVLGGLGAGGATGHAGEGAALGLATALGMKGLDKYGHSTAARLSDFLAKNAVDTGGRVGGGIAPYLELLKEDKKP